MQKRSSVQNSSRYSYSHTDSLSLLIKKNSPSVFIFIPVALFTFPSSYFFLLTKHTHTFSIYASLLALWLISALSRLLLLSVVGWLGASHCGISYSNWSFFAFKSFLRLCAVLMVHARWLIGDTSSQVSESGYIFVLNCVLFLRRCRKRRIPWTLNTCIDPKLPFS